MQSVAIYMRVSSERQAKEGDSIPAQRDALRKYVAERPGWAIYREYLDDGISGTLGDRGALNDLLEAVKAHKVDIIIFTKLDRWFRSIRHYAATQELLDKNGVSWVAIWEPIYDTTTPAGRLIVNQMMSIAQFEAENTGQRIRQVFEYKVQQGEVVTGRCPVGYSIENKKLVPNADAPDVVRAFELYAACGCLYDVVRDMQGTNLPTTAQGIRSMLTNKKYIGIYRGNNHYCPPLVSPALFEMVGSSIHRNIKKNQVFDYLFSGLLVCGDCGCRMAGLRRTYKRKTMPDKVYLQYRCPRHYQRPAKPCGNAKLFFESALEKYCLKYIEGIGGFKIDETAQARKEDGARARAAISRKIERLKELYINDLIDIAEYKADLDKYRAQLDAIPEDDGGPDMETIKYLVSLDLTEQYKRWNKSQRRGLWRAIIKEIRLYSTREIQVIFKKNVPC